MSKRFPHGTDVAGSNPPDSVDVTGSGVTRSFSAGVGFLVTSGVGATAVTTGVGATGVTTGVGVTVATGVTTGVGNFSQTAHNVVFPVGAYGELRTVVDVELVPQPTNL
jgi:uncharacterized membrane protein YccC